MKIKLNINVNKEREPFIITDYKRSGTVEYFPENLVYFDVTVNDNDKIFIYSISKHPLSDNLRLEELDFVFSEDDYSIFDEIYELKITEDKIWDILKKLDDELIDMYLDKKENLTLEFNI